MQGSEGASVLQNAEIAPFSFGSHLRIDMISFTRSTDRNIDDVRGYFWYKDCNSGFDRYSP